MDNWEIIDTTTPEDKLATFIGLSDAPLPAPLALLLLSDEVADVMEPWKGIKELHTIGEQIGALYQTPEVKHFIDALFYERQEFRLLQIACYRMMKVYGKTADLCNYAWDGLYGWMA